MLNPSEPLRTRINFKGNNWINPSKRLVDRAIEKWNLQNLRADNTTVVTVMLDPPGKNLSLFVPIKRQFKNLYLFRSSPTASTPKTKRKNTPLAKSFYRRYF